MYVRGEINGWFIRKYMIRWGKVIFILYLVWNFCYLKGLFNGIVVFINEKRVDFIYNEDVIWFFFFGVKSYYIL